MVMVSHGNTNECMLLNEGNIFPSFEISVRSFVERSVRDRRYTESVRKIIMRLKIEILGDCQ